MAETETSAAGSVAGVDSRYIVNDVTGAGSRFFSADNMRLFRSRVAGTGYRVTFPDTFTYVVVTSETDFYDDNRAYTVRVFTFTDHGRNVSRCEDSAGFRGYGSRAAAMSAARRVAVEIGAGRVTFPDRV